MYLVTTVARDGAAVVGVVVGNMDGAIDVGARVVGARVVGARDDDGLAVVTVIGPIAGAGVGLTVGSTAV